ncbi:MAG: hypothetical protein CVT47_01400 [Thermoplasmata archaeon HGW-Thermoplasmata-2]|nr:MAG: hypothetical protein CVT47_01400 [Thermoplasmata archaeon HGW-Thermoplasmata-2]
MAKTNGITGIVQNVFSGYGFQLQEHPKLKEMSFGAFSIPVFGTKGNISVVAALKQEKGTKSDVLAFGEVVKVIGADQGIFIAVSGFDDDAKWTGKSERIILWDRNTLCAEIGKAVLSELEAKAKPDQQRVGKETYARLKIGDQMAALAGKNKMFNVKSVNLKLVPYYLFDYSMDLLEEGSLDVKTFAGKLMVDATTKEINEVRSGMEISDKFTEPHVKMSFGFSKYDAFAAVNELLVRAGTRTVEVQERKGSTIVTVKKQMRPKEESIKIGDMGIIYMPVWHVESANGLIEIDGVTGTVIAEKRYKLDSSILKSGV